MGLAALNVPTLSSMSSVPLPARVTLTICGPARFDAGVVLRRAAR